MSDFAVVACCQAREKEDDEIVASMNRYTQKLQASLHIINSADLE